MRKEREMLKRRDLVGTLVFATFALPGCKVLAGLLPVIADIIGDIAKAQEALTKIDSVMGAFFAVSPNEELQKAYTQGRVVVDDSLGVVLLLAQGAEKASREEMEAAWADFRRAYAALLEIVAKAGFTVTTEGALATVNMEGELLEIPAPDSFKGKY